MWSDCVPDRLSPKDITEPRARLSHTLWSISNARVTLPQRRDHACSFRFLVKNRRIFVRGLRDWQMFYTFALHENTRTKYRLRRSNASVTLPQRRDHAWSFRFWVKSERIVASGLRDLQNFYPFALHENTRTKYRLRRPNASQRLTEGLQHPNFGCWNLEFGCWNSEFGCWTSKVWMLEQF